MHHMIALKETLSELKNAKCVRDSQVTKTSIHEIPLLKHFEQTLVVPQFLPLRSLHHIILIQSQQGHTLGFGFSPYL